jgi:hypothetical protein
VGAKVLPAPEETHWAAGVPSWSPLGNLDHACCAESAVGHGLQTVTWNTKRYYNPTTAAILKLYADVTDWDPVTGANDNGTYAGDLILRMKGQGLEGHRYEAVAVMYNWFNPRALLGAIHNFGVVLLAMSLPDDYAEQFYAKQPFHKTGPANPDNGHLIACSGASSSSVWGNTWGKQKELLSEFVNAYAYGVYVPLGTDWIGANGKTPSGLTRQKAMTYLRSLGALV